jgi:hypothetical protein
MSDDPARAAEGARAREQLNRRLQTSHDLGRLIRFKASYSPAKGSWNLFLAWLGAAILVAVIAVNVLF